jgi:predicted nuclease of predicted toxin-antitoxin system
MPAMRFLIDAQLPPSLAATLRDCGQEAAHVFDLLPADARETAIWRIALDSGYVLVTKDEDNNMSKLA